MDNVIPFPRNRKPHKIVATSATGTEVTLFLHQGRLLNTAAFNLPEEAGHWDGHAEAFIALTAANNNFRDARVVPV